MNKTIIKNYMILFFGCVFHGLSISISIPFFKAFFLVGGTLLIIEGHQEIQEQGG